MKTKFLISAIFLLILNIGISQTLQNIVNQASTSLNNGSSGNNSSNPLTNDQVVKGLKEALTIGATNSTGIASKLDGFYKNPALFIPFPPEAKKVKDYAKQIGLSAQVTKFEMTLNRAAEEAAKNAGSVFLNAIKGMSISDGFAILKGGNNAATLFLKNKTTAELTQKFTPIVKAAIEKVQLTKYWNPIITKYNKIPLVQKQNPNLTSYVTERALKGLFKLLADEELKIRTNPAAQITTLLQNVFGSLLH
ncbi:MAG: hypothetical protein A3F72_14795 [Bacteroidetes bacterium RIFCSPLOWO2_12_FULL_35_15]|nr:MAG: hypothetical protein A3F72_14795 [Bacteroidetes bacterium RIFCSPLOWO2_12_FULL_35_15]